MLSAARAGAPAGGRVLREMRRLGTRGSGARALPGAAAGAPQAPCCPPSRRRALRLGLAAAAGAGAGGTAPRAPLPLPPQRWVWRTGAAAARGAVRAASAAAGVQTIAKTAPDEGGGRNRAGRGTGTPRHAGCRAARALGRLSTHAPATRPRSPTRPRPPAAPAPAPATVVLDVGGMKCGGCSAAVKRMLLGHPGVAAAAVNLLTETAAVQVDGADPAVLGPQAAELLTAKVRRRAGRRRRAAQAGAGLGASARDGGAGPRPARPRAPARRAPRPAALAPQGFPAKVRSEETAAVDSDAAEARRLEEARRSNINLAVAWGLVLVCCRCGGARARGRGRELGGWQWARALAGRRRPRGLLPSGGGGGGGRAARPARPLWRTHPHPTLPKPIPPPQPPRGPRAPLPGVPPIRPRRLHGGDGQPLGVGRARRVRAARARPQVCARGAARGAAGAEPRAAAGGGRPCRVVLPPPPPLPLHA
jgi:copper chaperone CopZ